VQTKAHENYDPRGSMFSYELDKVRELSPYDLGQNIAIAEVMLEAMKQADRERETKYIKHAIAKTEKEE
jgi:hypothetical protein